MCIRFFASDYINSETAFPFSQSHTAVFACGFKKEFTLLNGQFLTVRCQNCQAGRRSTGSKNPRDLARMIQGSRFKTGLASNKNGRCLVNKPSHWWLLKASNSISNHGVPPHLSSYAIDPILFMNITSSSFLLLFGIWNKQGFQSYYVYCHAIVYVVADSGFFF